MGLKDEASFLLTGLLGAPMPAFTLVTARISICLLRSLIPKSIGLPEVHFSLSIS